MNKERKVDPGMPLKSDAAVDSKQGAAAKNTRRFLRLPIATPTVIRYLNGDPATRTYILSSRLPGTLLNIGAGGALVLCENAPQPGELLTLEVRLQDEFEFGGVLGKVKRVEPDEEGGFLVGIEFGVLKSLCPERSA